MTDDTSIKYGPTLVLSHPPHKHDGPLLDWMVSEGLLDWVSADTGADCE